MDYFHYQNGELFCEETSVSELARKYGTPLWIYSKRTLLHHIRQIQTSFAEVDPVICYSVKANSSLGVLRVMREAGSSFDVVSGGGTLSREAGRSRHDEGRLCRRRQNR